MAHTDKISELVQTVRQLNWEVRPKISGMQGGNETGTPLHQALAAIRDHEIRVSRRIRGMSLADTPVGGEDVGRVIEQAGAEGVRSRQLLSEFATARESILSIVRNLTDEEWTATQQTAEGEFTYEGVVDNLIESDKQHMSKIQSAIA